MRAAPLSGIEPSDLELVTPRGSVGDEARQLSAPQQLGRRGAVTSRFTGELRFNDR